MTGDQRKRMTAWDFHARGRDGVVKLVSFYSVTKGEAAELARAWAARAGYVIEGES